MEAQIYESVQRIYYIFKLNCMLVMGFLLGLCGLSSLSAAVEAHQEAGGDTGLLSFRKWWKIFVRQLKATWLLSWAYNVAILVLLWLIWLTSQLVGIIFLMGLFIQVALLFLVFLTFLADGHLRAHIEASSYDHFKLALFQVFMAGRVNLLHGLYWLVLFLLFKSFPAIIAFWAGGMGLYVFHPLYLKVWHHYKII